MPADADGVMPADLKARPKTFVPAARENAIRSLDQLSPTFDVCFERWNAESKKKVYIISEVPLGAHEQERAAQRDLFSVLRLVDAGKVAVSDATRRPSGRYHDSHRGILEGGG